MLNVQRKAAMKTKSTLGLAVVLLTAAVYSHPAMAAPHDDQIEVNQAAIINALVAGAQDHAAAELKMARDKMALARRLAAEGDFEGARKQAALGEVQALRAEARAAKARMSQVSR